MYNNNDRLFSFLSLVAILGFIALGVSWLQDGIGIDKTIIVIGALVGVLIFAGGGIFAYSIQRITLDAIARFNGSDAQIDRYRQSTFREIARGETAERRADATLRVLDAKRVDQIAQQRAGLLVDLERQQWEQRQQQDAWGALDDGDGALFNVME